MNQIKSKLTLRIALLGGLIGMMPLSQSYAGFYKWTDEEGVTHYGDRPPPVNTSYGHQVLNKSGASVKTIKRELTPAERLKASRMSQDKVQQLRKERDLERIDRLIRVSFPNFKTLATARDDRLETLDDSIAYLQSRRDSLLEKHSANNSRIQHFQRKKLSIPDKLTKEASTINKSVEQLNAQIADIEKDRESTVAEFDQYERRLSELLDQ